MSLWQKAMIGLARNGAIKRFMQETTFTARMARQFVGGSDAEAAIGTGKELKDRRISCSFFYLGEYVEDPAQIEENIAQIISIIQRLAYSDLDLHVSVDPTQIGYSISEGFGRSNALRISEVISGHAGKRRVFMMLDMEDVSFVQKTVDLHALLCERHVPAAITLQAYLLRTEADIRTMISQGSVVRLVKGAFVGERHYAFVNKKDIDSNYRHLAELLLSHQARENRVYPVFGTHDHRIIHHIQEVAYANGWPLEGFEFEMLYGVRPSLQQEILNSGYSLRLYLPFGSEWWPYTVRRVGENPANLRFVLKSILRG